MRRRRRRRRRCCVLVFEGSRRTMRTVARLSDRGQLDLHRPRLDNIRIAGGVFNRTVNIHLGDKHSIVIQQEFRGREGDVLRTNVIVSGTLPTLEPDAAVSFSDYDEARGACGVKPPLTRSLVCRS